jgi:hypothetical protein
MAWAFLTIGLILLIAAIRGKHKDLFELAKSDFTGANNFFIWVLAIVILAALGTFRPIRPVTDAFLGLVILVIIIAPYRNGRDLVSEFQAQLRNGTQ